MTNDCITKRSLKDRKTGKTDWAAFDAKTDEQIAQDVADDPDAAPLITDLSKFKLVRHNP